MGTDNSIEDRSFREGGIIIGNKGKEDHRDHMRKEHRGKMVMRPNHIISMRIRRGTIKGVMGIGRDIIRGIMRINQDIITGIMKKDQDITSEAMKTSQDTTNAKTKTQTPVSTA